MGAHPEHGRRRPCSRHDCCLPHPRAVENAHVRRDITRQLDAVLDELAPRDTATDGGR